MGQTKGEGVHKSSQREILGLELRSPNPVLFRLTIFIISSATGVWFKGILTQKSCMEIGKVVWPSHQGADREEDWGRGTGEEGRAGVTQLK